MMRLPVPDDPVKLIMSTRGSPVRTSPTSALSPAVTMFRTPGGRPVCSAARAGPSFERFSMKGKFQGVIAPTTPTGSRTISELPTSSEKTVSSITWGT